MRYNLANLKTHYNHIKNGKLIHKEFDFCQYNSLNGNGETNYCGTAGCSFGEVPAWCVNVTFHDNSERSFKYNGEVTVPLSIAKIIFGINDDEFDHLFIPEEQKPSLYGGNILSMLASKEEVNRNLLIFIEKIENGKIV